MTNAEIAKLLRAEAKTLNGKVSALYRIRAYRQAANWIAMYPRDLVAIYSVEGRAGLERIPGVGSHLSYAIEGLLTTGILRPVGGSDDHHEPNRRTSSLPGIGPLTAARLRDETAIETVDQLAEALDRAEGHLPGLGPRRVAVLRESLRQRPSPSATNEPEVGELLALDTLFREQAGDDPFTASSLNWSRGGYRYRIEYDRSALAFRLERIGDRVVIRFAHGTETGERIVETEPDGMRVVRGREEECRSLVADRAEVR